MKIELEVVPQGNFPERLRAAGAGKPTEDGLRAHWHLESEKRRGGVAWATADPTTALQVTATELLVNLKGGGKELIP